MARSVELLQVPTGPALLDVLPRLRAALDGSGPALAPVAAGDTAQIARLGAAFGAGQPLSPAEDDPDDPTAIVVATSGSTGTPKGTLLSASALAASAAATQRRLGPAGTWLLALPAQHIAGLQVLLRSLATGVTPFLMDTAAPFTAARFAAAADSLPGGPRYVSLVPTQLHRILDDPAATEVLAGFDGVLVGGSATAAALQRRARAAGIALVTTYGMSETCGGCVYDGRPLDGVGVDLDPAGRILLSGPMIGRGYRNLPRHQAFRGRTFVTDDLGCWVDGRLQINGRVDDLIVSGGLKIAPAAVEEAIATLPTIAQVVVVGLPDAEWGARLVAVAVAASGQRPTLHQLQRAVREAGIRTVPRDLVLLPDLPARGPGKPDRTAAAELALAALTARAENDLAEQTAVPT